MKRLLSLSRRSKWLLFAFLDTACVGMGMGVPIFCTAFGFLVGFYLAQRAALDEWETAELLRAWLRQGTLTACFTLLIMLLIWGPSVRELWNPRADLINFGIPMILYDPRASFVGWLVLMVFISPFLQLLTTLFGAHVTMVWLLRGGRVRRRQAAEHVG